MGDVIRLSRYDVEGTATGWEIGEGEGATILLDRDLETDQWVWRILTHVENPPFKGGRLKLLLLIQQDPQVLYPTTLEAHLAAKDALQALELPQHVLR